MNTFYIKEGDRIEMVSMENDPNPIPKGTKGTVLFVTPLWGGETQLVVKWDNGRTLSPILPQDDVRVIS